MSKSLDEVKKHISMKYLGKAGIHSVGVSRAENALRVYVDSEAEDALRDILSEIEREAAPFKIVPIKSDRSSIT